MTTICLYNHWHMGDVFSGRGHLMNLMKQYPGFHYVYAINGHPHALTDLRCPILHVNQLPPQVTYQMSGAIAEDQVWVNTWVGAYMQVMDPGEHHANWRSLQRQWQLIYDKLNEVLKINLPQIQDPLQGVPEIDWSCYNTQAADVFLNTLAPHRSKVLVCNGPVRSGQSVWQSDWQEQVVSWAHTVPHHVFICTHEFACDLPNVKFTNHIFSQPCDLNEIAYLSTKCDMIMGKNSGPFMYCHVKENVWNPKIKILACSDRPSDSYAHGSAGFTCAYYHSLSEDATTLKQHVMQVLQAPDLLGFNQMKVLT